MEAILYYFAPLAFEVAALSTNGSLNAARQFITGQREESPFLDSLEPVAVHPNSFEFRCAGSTLIVGFRADAGILSDTSTQECDISYTQDGVHTTRNVVFYSAALEVAQAAMKHILPSLNETVEQRGRVIFTGHAAGGTVAAIASVLCFLRCPDADMWKPVEVMGKALDASEDSMGMTPKEFSCFTFGAPLPGTRRLASAIEATGVRRVFYHFNNVNDPIPTSYGFTTSSLLERAAHHFLNGNARRATLGYFSTLSEIKQDCKSPCFGTYVTLGSREPERTCFNVERDREAAFEQLKRLRDGNREENRLGLYRQRLHQLRTQALHDAWGTHDTSRLALKNRYQLCFPKHTTVVFSETRQEVMVLAYDLRRRCFFAANRATKPLRLCLTVASHQVITVAESNIVARRLSPQRIHIAVTVPSGRMQDILVMPLSSLCDALTAFEIEAYHEEDEHDINRNLMPLVHCVLTVSNNDRVSTFVYISSTSLPSTGSCRVVIRQTAPQPEELFFTVPNEKVETVALLNKNCKTVKRTAAGRAVAMIRVTLPRGLQGYAVCAEFDEGDVAPYDWNLVRCRRTP